MTVVLVLIVVLAVGLGVALVVGRWSTGVRGLDEPTTSLAHTALPDGPVDPDAVDEVRFDRAWRGYRMEQVDVVLDRLTAELRDRDEQLARLTAPEPAADAEHAFGPATEPAER